MQLAWAEAGSGPLLVKAANWLTHLELRLGEPGLAALDPLLRRPLPLRPLRRARLRHDATGTSATCRSSAGSRISRRWSRPPRPSEPFVLLGISQGAATCDRLRRAPPGARDRASSSTAATRRAGRAAATTRSRRQYQRDDGAHRLGWGSDNPVFRQVFTSRFIPGGTDEQIDWFNDLCRKTTSPGDRGASC